MTPKQALRTSALFAQLSEREIDEVVAIISEREVEPGEMVIREGEEGYSLFILEEGHVDVLRNAEQGATARITELGEGSIFGEMSFVEHLPARTAGVMAHGRAKVLELRFDALERLAETDPVLGVKLYRTIAVSLNQKLRGTTDHLLPLVASARMAALGQMTANIAHELGNPLTVLQSLSAGISEGTSGELAEWARKIGTTVAHVGRVIAALRSVSRDGSADPFVRGDTGSIIRETLAFCEQRFRHFGIQLDVAMPNPAPAVRCRPVQVSQALLNLLNNSVDALASLPEGRPRWIRVTSQLAEDGQVILSIEDSGAGMSPEVASRIFKPFYTTKGVGAGTGLGLSLSRQLVEANGGSLTLVGESDPTRFEIRLPVA